MVLDVKLPHQAPLKPVATRLGMGTLEPMPSALPYTIPQKKRRLPRRLNGTGGNET